MLVGSAIAGQFAVSANDGSSQMTALVIETIAVFVRGRLPVALVSVTPHAREGTSRASVD